MKFKIDHDFHIHSKLSLCSNDEGQTAENILKYAKKNGLKKICITDHFWDENVSGASGWYAPQNYEHISAILPLPKDSEVKFHFGCETEMDKYMNLGLSSELMDKFDFIIIPTTHMHMTGFTIDEGKTSIEDRARVYTEKLDKLMDMDLPFHKIGIAHLTCCLIAPNHQTDFDEHICIIDAVSDDKFKNMFFKIAQKGAGVELNFAPAKYNEEQLERILRPYRIAKEVGCKFYLGSDAHHPNELDYAPAQFEDIVKFLELKESDKFEFNK